MAFIPRRAIQLLLLGLVAAHAAVPPCEHAPDCKAASTCEQYGGPNTESQPIFDTICLNNVKWAEPSFSGKYDKFWDSGVYKCSCCGQELYSSEHKYDSRSGWPAYYDTISPSAVLLNPEDGELVCSRCGLHLGHRFTDGPQDVSAGSGPACLYMEELARHPLTPLRAPPHCPSSLRRRPACGTASTRRA